MMQVFGLNSASSVCSRSFAFEVVVICSCRRSSALVTSGDRWASAAAAWLPAPGTVWSAAQAAPAIPRPAKNTACAAKLREYMGKFPPLHERRRCSSGP
jgi:hypothetical protein